MVSQRRRFALTGGGGAALTLLDSSLLLLVGQLLLKIGLVGVGELGEIEGGVHCDGCKEVCEIGMRGVM